eukprot:scaffold39899_cov60-Phaeocystis_antarctica.AAC.3
MTASAYSSSGMKSHAVRQLDVRNDSPTCVAFALPTGSRHSVMHRLAPASMGEPKSMLTSGESQRSQWNSPGARSSDKSKSDRPYTASSGPSAQYRRVRLSARHCCGQGQSLELKQKPVERSGAGECGGDRRTEVAALHGCAGGQARFAPPPTRRPTGRSVKFSSDRQIDRATNGTTTGVSGTLC